MQQPQHITQAENELKRQAKALGFEVLTPAATCELFGKSAGTVRDTARGQRIETVFTVQFSGRAVRLYRLASCIDYWRTPNLNELERMRANGHVLFVSNADGQGGNSYNVLHTERLVTLETAAD